MFCPKCGTSVNDDDYACYKCGHILANKEASAEESKPVEANTDSKSDMNTTSNNTVPKISIDIAPANIATEPAKKINKALVGVIAGAAVLAVAGIAGGVYYYNSTVLPKKQLQAAIDDEDTSSVIELYEQVDDEAIKMEAIESLIEHAKELKEDYIAESITYKDIIAELDMIQETIGESNDQLEEITELVNTINDSRKVYAQAVEDYNSSEFSKAIAEYSEVIREDEKYYELAKEGLKKCDEGLRAAVEGDWSFKYDVIDDVNYYISSLGVELPVNTLPVTIQLSMNEDGTIKVTLDEDCMDTYMDLLFQVAEEYFYNEMEQAGVTQSQMELGLYYLYGSTDIKEIINEYMSMDDLIEDIQDEFDNRGLDTYKVDTGKFYINDVCMDIEYSDDKITISSEDQDKIVFGTVEYDLPLELSRISE